MRTSLDKVKDYAYMTGRPFTCKQLVRDLGIGSTMAAIAIRKLLDSEDIALISSPRKGIYKAMSDKMKQRARAKRLAAEAEDMRINGDEYHQILSEV